MLALALALLLASTGAAPADTSLVTAADASPAGASAVDVTPRFSLGALYSPTYGVGLGGGVLVEGLGAEGTRAVVDARASQYLQRAAVSFATADPRAARLYALVAGAASTETRRPYYGLGPFTQRDDRVFLDLASASAELRVGGAPLGSTALYVQPSARLLFDRLRGIAADEERTLDALDAASREAVQTVEGVDRYGVSAGLAVGTDLRDHARYPERGVAASVEARRFVALDDTGLRFNRVAASWEGYLPVGRATLFGRADAALTRADGGVEEAIPFYYLPAVDHRLLAAYPLGRLRGRDVLLVGAGARVPVVDVIGLYGIDAVVVGTLGNAYDDVFDQFEARVDAGRDVVVADGAPLRPAVEVGANVVNRRKRSVLVGAALGFSPEGSVITTFRLAIDLRSPIPLFR